MQLAKGWYEAKIIPLHSGHTGNILSSSLTQAIANL